MMNQRYTSLLLIIASLTFLFGCDLEDKVEVVPGKISGTILYEGTSLANVQISSLADTGETSTTTTDSNGQYSFSYTAGSYTITPTKTGYTFDPETLSVTVTGTDEEGYSSHSGQDFVATVTISGTQNGEVSSVYSYDDAIGVFENQASTYTFTYYNNATAYNGKIKTVSRDVGQNGIIDSIDYFSYDAYGLLESIERDIDNNRSANERFGFTIDPDISEAQSVLDTATAKATELVDAQTAYDAALIAEETAQTAADEAEAAYTLAVAAESAAKTASETTLNAATLAAYEEAKTAKEEAQNTLTDADTALATAKAAVNTTNNALKAAQTAADEAGTVQDALTNLNNLVLKNNTAAASHANVLTGANGASSVYEYDEATGNLLSAALYLDGDTTTGSADSTSYYFYNDNGDLLYIEYNDDDDNIMDAISYYTYDSEGNVSVIERDDNYDGTAESLYLFEYDLNGNVTRVSRDDGADGSIDASNIYTYSITYNIDNALLTIEQDASYSQYISNSIGFFNIEMY